MPRSRSIAQILLRGARRRARRVFKPDNLGNVVAYADAEGSVVAAYAYDAFGRTASASGPLAATFEHGFSTKPLDPETGLHYYGYRFYDSGMGRWMNRDPMLELGGVNLFTSFRNGPFHFIDILGLSCRVHIVFGHSFDFKSSKLTQCRMDYENCSAIDHFKDFMNDIVPAFAMTKTTELFQTMDENDRLTAITCYSDVLLSYLNWIWDHPNEKAKSSPNKETKEEWTSRINETVDPLLSEGKTVIGGSSVEAIAAYESAALRAIQYFKQQKQILCNGDGTKPPCCKQIVLTFHIDPARKDQFFKTIAPSKSQQFNNLPFFFDTVQGKEHYEDVSQVGETLSISYDCQSHEAMILGDLSEDQITSRMEAATQDDP